VSVTQIGRLTFLPFRTPPNASQPAGIWTSQITVLGDASGGNVFANHEVILLTEPFSALMLTLEQIHLTDTTNASVTWLFEATGFEEHDPVGNRNVLIHFAVIGGGPEAATALLPTNSLRRPVFLGRCDRTSGQDSTMRVIRSNVDAASFRSDLFGYYWTPDAMNAPGGPQRPPGSLFGN